MQRNKTVRLMGGGGRDNDRTVLEESQTLDLTTERL